MKYENVEYRIGKYAFARGSFQDLRNYLRSGTIGETPKASLPKMTGETPEVRSDKRKQREEREKDRKRARKRRKTEKTEKKENREKRQKRKREKEIK